MTRLRTMMIWASAAAMPIAASAQDQPVAVKKPHEVVTPFGAVRQDPYYWLRDDKRTDPEMLAYLTAENLYADKVLAPLADLKQRLYEEAVSHVQQRNTSVPYRHNGYWYQTRFDANADYPVVMRRADTQGAQQDILLDQPTMAKGHGYFEIGTWTVSINNRLLAFTQDTIGRWQYELRLKDLTTGRMLSDVVPNVDGDILWAKDNRTMLYVEKDPKTLLSKRVKAHVLGTPASADRTVYEEADTSFYIRLKASASEDYLCIMLDSTRSTEQRCARADTPTLFTTIAPRAKDFRYEADHAHGRWIVRTDWNAANYKVMTVGEADVGKGRAAWRDLVPADPATFIERTRPFDSFVVIEERKDGNKQLRLLSYTGKSVPVAADEPSYMMWLADEQEHDSPWVRYTYNSLVTPETTYEANAVTGERRLLKVEHLPGYDPSRYVTERVWITARDGARIPVSLAYAKTVKKDGTAPLLQYGYGAYGSLVPILLSPERISLMDRGVVYAVAHVRGGQELGRAWYDGGRLLNKMNSFTDFIDVTRGLVAGKYAAKDRVAAFGRSAGGLLVGGVANMVPTEYRAIIAHVPFVDAVTTMLDPSIPLTTNEYDEWGNPADPLYYKYMLQYSPYDNVRAQAYPAMFISTSLWDSQVQYFEPAKWVAILRAIRTNSNPLVFRTSMAAGHSGKSGRFEPYRDSAEWEAFLLHALRVPKVMASPPAGNGTSPAIR